MAYEIFRHPEGGRKDAFRWSDGDKKPVAELEIYRPGGESTNPAAIAEIAADGPDGCTNWRPRASSTASSAR